MTNINEKHKVAVVASEIRALQLSLGNLLSDLGYAVDFFSVPLDAVQHSIKIKPDLVVVDFQFNELMGLEVIQQIKIKYPDMPSILLVNDLSHPDVKRAMSLGAVTLDKPINREKLEMRLNELNKKSAMSTSEVRNIFLIVRNPNIRFPIKQILKKYDNIDIVHSSEPHDLIERFFTKKWDLIIFNIDNSFLPEDDFLQASKQYNFDPDTFILLADNWTDYRKNKFLKNNYQFFLSIPLDRAKAENVISQILDNKAL